MVCVASNEVGLESKPINAAVVEEFRGLPPDFRNSFDAKWVEIRKVT